MSPDLRLPRLRVLLAELCLMMIEKKRGRIGLNLVSLLAGRAKIIDQLSILRSLGT